VLENFRIKYGVFITNVTLIMFGVFLMPRKTVWISQKK